MWILPKNHQLSSAFAPECLGSKEELKKHVVKLIGKNQLPQLMWKSKPSPYGIWLSRWSKVYWMQHLFTRTLKPSAEKNFVIKFTESLGDIRANRSHCQEKGGGAEDPRHLWPYISGIIKSVRPVFCFFENVSGHLSMGFDEVYRSLRDLGFRVEAGIYTAEEVGAPHKRERIFILAILEDPTRIRRRGRSDVGKNRGRSFQIERPSTLGDTKSFNKSGNGISEEGEQKQIGGPGNELAHTYGCGGGKDTKSSELWAESVEQSPMYSWGAYEEENEERRFNRWPSGPGSEQKDWEEPRVKSKLGFTVNGYNFRDDLLRMAGNGVVEQVAELAFLDLLEKHGL